MNISNLLYQQVLILLMILQQKLKQQFYCKGKIRKCLPQIKRLKADYTRTLYIYGL